MNREGDLYWKAVLCGTVIYDGWALMTGHETASGAMRRYTERPGQKLLLCGAMAGLALHFVSEQLDLCNVIYRREGHEIPEAD